MTGPPRSPSGGGVAGCTPALRNARRCRSGRRALALRYAWGAIHIAPETACRRRTPQPIRDARRPAHRAIPRDRARPACPCRRRPRTASRAPDSRGSRRPRSSSASVRPGRAIPGTTGTPNWRDRGFGGDLVAHRLDRCGRRPDERDASCIECRREFGVLRKEPVARVDGLSPVRRAALTTASMFR